MRKLIIVVFFLTIFAETSVFAGEGPWQLKKNRDGVAVYTRKVDGSPILEYKSSVVVDVPLEKVISFFEDPQQMPRWFYQCVRLDLVEDESPEQKILYFVIHLPWPVVERDSVFRRTKLIDDVNKTVSYSLEALPNKLPPVKGKIRVLSIKSLWRFTALADGKTEVYFQQHTNPGGSIPAFLVNQLVVDIPFKSLRNLRKLVTLKDKEGLSR